MLKRFVTYIYQYEGGRRGSNAGFVKADIRDAGCRIQIQLRTPDRLQGTCKAYLIVGGENPVGIFAGEIPLHQGTGQLRLAYPRSLLTADGHTVGQVQAVALRCSGGNHLLSCWTDQVPEAVLYGKFDIWGEHVQPTPENMPETAVDSENSANFESDADKNSDADSTADSRPASADKTAAADNSTAADTAGSADATSTTTADASAATGTASTLTAPLDTADAPDAGSDAPEAVSDDAPAPEATCADTATASPALEAASAPAAPEAASEAPPRPAAADAFPAQAPTAADEASPHSAAADDTDTAPASTPSVGIADAPTPAEEKLISFGVTPEPLSAEEMQTDITPTPQAPQSAPAAADTKKAPDADCPCLHRPQQDRPDQQTTPQEITYEKIAISDIRQKLTRRNWYLCSNSFLIHGFFNYRYLILKTVKTDGQKKCFLGVPGIYEQPERTMAFMFGFPIFEPAREQKTPKAPAETDAHTPQPSIREAGVFGYWMLQLMD